MSAEMRIHILDNTITEKDLKIFFGNTMGSKYFAGLFNQPKYDKWEKVAQKIEKTDSIVIGNVSWLKAAITEDNESFIPGAVEEIKEIIGENLPVISNSMIEEIAIAFDKPNKSGYKTAKKEDVIEWLQKNKGKKVFTVSW
jgi:hypothetical protein